MEVEKKASAVEQLRVFTEKQRAEAEQRASKAEEKAASSEQRAAPQVAPSLGGAYAKLQAEVDDQIATVQVEADNRVASIQATAIIEYRKSEELKKVATASNTTSSKSKSSTYLGFVEIRG